MSTLQSKDGTSIAYDQIGQGPALILVDGALCFRSFGPMPGLAQLLAPDFTVITYDRRGRGESGDTQPFAVQREVEDIEALIDHVGGSAYVFGTSSGGALALEAAMVLGSKIKKLAIYEAPYNDDPVVRQATATYTENLKKALAAGNPGEGVTLFMKLVGTPDEAVNGMRQSPVWPVFESVGPTLLYDITELNSDGAIPAERVSRINVPTLVMNGGAGAPFMHVTATTLAQAIPNAEQKTLEGQTHEVDVNVLAPALKEFFAS